MLFCQKTNRTHKIITWVTVEPPLIHKMINCMQQTQPRKAM